MHEKDTEELFSELREDEDIRDFLSRNEKEFCLPLNEYLGQLLEAKHLEKRQVVRESLLERPTDIIYFPVQSQIPHEQNYCPLP